MGLWSSKPVPYSDVCSICLEPRPDEIKSERHRRNFVITSYDHMFHRECLEQALIKSNLCPICRVNLVISPEIKVKKYKYDDVINEEDNYQAYTTVIDQDPSVSGNDEFDTLRFV